MEFSTLTRRIAEALGDRAAGGRRRRGRRFRRRQGAQGAAGPGAEKAPDCAAAAESPGAAVLEAARAGQERRSTARSTRPSRPASARGVDHRSLCGRPRRLRHRDDRRSTRCAPSSSASRWPSRPGKACYVPLGHRRAAGELRLRRARWHRSRSPSREALALLKPLLEEPSILKIGQNIKYDLNVLAQHGITLALARRHDADVLRARRRQGQRTAWTISPCATSGTPASRSIR